MERLAANGAEVVAVSGSAPRLGGEAAVYEATADGAPCVVKVALTPAPHGEWLDAERALLEDLGREPSTAHLVPRVLAHGRWHDRPFVALERFDGTALDATAGAGPAARLAVARRVAEVVAALHEARPGLVHGDLKPTNVLVSGGRVVVADFGAARSAPVTSTTTTRARSTAGYAAPEQALPHRVRDPSWDSFGLAATVFHLVVGRPARAPTTHAARVTAAGRRLRAGLDEGRGPAWDYLELDGPGLEPGDRDALDAVVEGPLGDALAAAMHPDPRQRRGAARDLLAALVATRPTGHRRRSWALAALVAAAASSAAAAALTIRAARPPPAPPIDLLPVPAGVEDGVPVAPFELARTEISQATWTDVMGDTLAERRQFDQGALGAPCTPFNDVSLVGADLPMVCVDFYDAARFANALSARAGLAPAYTFEPDGDGWRVTWDPASDGYRLPTGAEWQRALGAGSDDPCTENVADRAYRARWERAEIEDCDDGWPVAAPVGTFVTGPFGHADLGGNVAEWLWDEGDGTRAATRMGWGSITLGKPPREYGFTSPSLRAWTVGLRVARTPR